MMVLLLLVVLVVVVRGDGVAHSSCSSSPGRVKLINDLMAGQQWHQQ